MKKYAVYVDFESLTYEVEAKNYSEAETLTIKFLNEHPEVVSNRIYWIGHSEEID